MIDRGSDEDTIGTYSRTRILLRLLHYGNISIAKYIDFRINTIYHCATFGSIGLQTFWTEVVANVRLVCQVAKQGKESQIMDGQQFDRFTRMFGRRISRREAVKGIAGTAIGGTLLAIGLTRSTQDASAQASDCLAGGEACSEGRDCCSGNCDASTGYCMAEEGQCLEAGEACSAGRDCCSGTCDASSGYCVNVDNCLANGEACSAGRDCCSATCDASTGYCVAVGGSSGSGTSGGSTTTTMPATGSGTSLSEGPDWMTSAALIGGAAAAIGAVKLHQKSQESEL